jgi:hypothetical protein
MSKHVLSFSAVALALGATLILTVAASPAPRAARGDEIPLDIAKIYWEYNSSGNDLGVHVLLDGEDWRMMEIENPDERVIFEVRGKGPYRQLGMTELFFEGAEPSLADVPLEDLLELFPEGEYEFSGLDVDGEEIEGVAEFTHAIPAGPVVFTQWRNGFLRINWFAVTGPPPGFPNRPIDIVAYQVIVGDFQVTVPDSVLGVTVTPEYVATLPPGQHGFEVLAIDASGNQSITEGTFIK